MACAACEERRKIAEEAYARAGLRGVVKTVPKLIKHTLQQPPVIRKSAKGE